MWKKPAKNSYEIHNQPIRKANDWKIYHSSNQRHERLYFKVVGNKRAVFCKNKMEEDAATFAYSLSLRGRQNLDRTGSDYGSDPVRDPIRSNLDFVDAALLEGTIDDFIDEQENRNTRAKTDRDVNLLKTSLQRKIELRNVEEMPPFFFFRFYKLYISLFPRASMDTSLAAEWVTLVESHLLTYSCSTQWNALRFRSQCQSQRWKWLRGMIAGFKQYLKRKNF